MLGIKNRFKLEGVINSWECWFSFLNRSIPIFLKEEIVLKLKEQKLIKIEATFLDEILVLAIIKLLDKSTQSKIMLKVKFMLNTVMLDMMNNSSETLILNPKEALGVLDLSLLGYYKIWQGVLQENLSTFYEFESVEKVCDQFNNSINTLKKEEKLETGEKYPWLDKTVERKYMIDRETLEKYIDLDNTCLTEKEIMDILYKYKEVFSLRDEIGTCPNIEVEIEVTDKSLFCIDCIMLGKKIRKL